MQIDLTFRNNPRNVKRRVLHNLGSRMCYITRPRTIAQRLLRNLSFNGCFAALVSMIASRPSFMFQRKPAVSWFRRILRLLVRQHRGRFYNDSFYKGWFHIGWLSFFLGCLHDSRTASFCFSFGHVARYAPSRKAKTYGTIAENSSQANL